MRAHWLTARIRLVSISAAALALAACGGSGGTSPATAGVQVVTAGPGPTPAPTPATSPPPTPPPPPTPTPVQTPATLPLQGVVAEGDSISVFWAGSHTGLYAASRPRVTFHGQAVGGAGIANDNGNGLMQRLAADLALRPAVVTVLIGANDLGTYASAKAWLDALWTYAAAVRASGAKLVVGTVLPIHLAQNPGYTALHNSRRAAVNAAIRAAVGDRIDAVVDFAADPVMGPDAAATETRLYGDGVHPSDATSPGGLDGQGRLAAIYTPVVDRMLGL